MSVAVVQEKMSQSGQGFGKHRANSRETIKVPPRIKKREDSRRCSQEDQLTEGSYSSGVIRVSMCSSSRMVSVASMWSIPWPMLLSWATSGSMQWPWSESASSLSGVKVFVFRSEGRCYIQWPWSESCASPLYFLLFGTFNRVIERRYLDSGQVMPPPKSFKPGNVTYPRRIIWDITDSLEKQINKAYAFNQKVCSKISLNFTCGSFYGCLNDRKLKRSM